MPLVIALGVAIKADCVAQVLGLMTTRANNRHNDTENLPSLVRRCFFSTTGGGDGESGRVLERKNQQHTAQPADTCNLLSRESTSKHNNVNNSLALYVYLLEEQKYSFRFNQLCHEHPSHLSAGSCALNDIWAAPCWESRTILNQIGACWVEFVAELWPTNKRKWHSKT